MSSRRSSVGALSLSSTASFESVPLTRQVLNEFFENCCSVSCLALFILIYARLLLQVNLFSPAIATNLFLAVLGLTMFGLGIRHGLMPLGEQVGTCLQRRVPKLLVLVTAFCVGVLCSIAEPAIGILEAAGEDTMETRTPLLKLILDAWANDKPFVLMLGIGAGVGFACIFGCTRLLYDLPIKRCIFAAALPTLSLTLFCVSEGGTFPEITGLAWDCGAVTTGPLTVPIVLSLGVGIAASTRRGSVTSADEPSLSGFGIVTFASLFPVFSVWAIGWAFGGRSVTVDPFREASLCFAKLAHVLLEGKDAELERLPDSIAAGLLKSLVALSATKENLSNGLRTWLQRRPLQELILIGKGQSHEAPKCLEILSSPSACSRIPGISTFSNLQMLCICHACTLKDVDLAVLRATHLETLQLESCPGLSGDFVEYLQLPAGSLRRLLCRDCGGISDRPLLGHSGRPGIGELTQTLTQLGFSGSARLSNELVAVLTGGLSRLETLSCLALSRTKVSMPGLKELSKRLGLKPLLPNRPKVLLRSFAAAQDLDAEILPAWASQAPAALDPVASLGSKDLAFWPEAAVRHATALALFQAALSRKRPADNRRPSLYGKSTVVSACVGACRAVLPLASFLLAVLLLLREKLENSLVVLAGLLCCIVGMSLFTLGLERGLVPLGANAGQNLPNAVAFYGRTMGALLIFAFGFLSGLLATFSEPALAALGKTVEQLSHGSYSKERLVFSVALGVGFGIAVGMAKVFFDLPLFVILVVGYLLCLVLTMLADEVMVCIAWDSAAVTTGPVTASWSAHCSYRACCRARLGQGVDCCRGLRDLKLRLYWPYPGSAGEQPRGATGSSPRFRCRDDGAPDFRSSIAHAVALRGIDLRRRIGDPLKVQRAPASECSAWMGASQDRGSLKRGFPSLPKMAQPQIPAEASSAAEAIGSKSQPRTKLSRAARAKKAQKEVRRKKEKPWCHVHIDPVCLELDGSFNKKVIGRGGENTRHINDLTGAKVRLRGRGSGHWEDAVRKGGKGWREAPVPLMIAVTSDDCDPGAFCLAVQMTGELLQWATGQCAQRHGGSHAWHLQRSMFWIGDLSPFAMTLLGAALGKLFPKGSMPLLRIVGILLR
eukprot:s83_g6.t2